MLIEATQQYSDLVAGLMARGPEQLRAVAGGPTYAELVASVALAQATPDQPVTVERLAWLLAGIGWRESKLGLALRQGTGDFGARLLTARRQGPRYLVVDSLPTGWSHPRDDSGAILPGPYCLPADGLGYGRSEWQHDYDAHPEVVDAVDPNGKPLWQDPAWACTQAALRLLLDLKALGQERFALAAYNCGVTGVRRALDAGQNVDANTTGRDYSMWVLERLTEWGAAG